jgi:hypothetical protein
MNADFRRSLISVHVCIRGPKIAFAALAAKQLDSGTEMFLDEKLMELQIPIVWRENDALSNPLCC